MTHSPPLLRDLRHLSPQLVTAGLLVLIGLFSIWAAARLHLQSETELQRVQQEGRALEGLLNNMAEEDRKLDEASQRYAMLKERGILGSGQRVQGIEALRKIPGRHHLLTFHYQLSPPHPLAAPSSTAPDSSFHFVATALQVSLTAQHEGRVIGALQDLQHRLPAYVQPRHCLLEKASAQPPIPVPLRLECQMDWITIEPRS